MLSGSYQSPNNESNSRSVSSSTRGISVTLVFAKVFHGPHWFGPIFLDEVLNVSAAVPVSSFATGV